MNISPPKQLDSGEITSNGESLLQRPEVLEGSTYKIPATNNSASFYVTINNITLNGRHRPFEMFANSKNMKNFEWVTALTRLASAVMRREENVAFLVAELQSIFDAKGGYYRPGGKWVNSVVAEIGDCLEEHLIKIGMIPSDGENQRSA
jgi:hypothetical protein